jgi:hypothetical protein
LTRIIAARPQSLPRPPAAKLERVAAATGTNGEQKLQNNQTVPDAARDK